MDAQSQTDFREYANRLETLCRAQADEIGRLRGELQRLTDLLQGSGLDAHTCLRDLYTNPESSESVRLRAAIGALGVEKPRLSMTAYAGKVPDRRTLWQTYQRWSLKNEIVLTTRKPPPPNYDAHLLADSYEPPPGDELPPRTIIDTANGFRIIGDDMLPSTSSNRRLGSNSDDGDSD